MRQHKIVFIDGVFSSFIYQLQLTKALILFIVIIKQTQSMEIVDTYFNKLWTRKKV
jgi:hypothetical protein